MNHLSISIRRHWIASVGTPLFFLLLVLAFLAGDLHAQSVQGNILGTVKDVAGALVPGATVNLRSLEEGTSRTTQSSSSGDYEFVDAKAGHYTVEVSLNGFEKWTATNVTLAARQQLRLNVSLVVGSIQQEVQVSGDTVSTIDTETPSINAVYSAAEAANLPVNTRASATGTSALSIVGTLPGVQADHGSFALQGGLPFQTEVSVDGITIQSAAGNSPIADAFPSSESISELRADGAMNNAEFGQPGEITITTKGGTNKIHGSVFWYHQNAAFDAIPYTYPITTIKPKLLGNTIGGSFGDPESARLQRLAVPSSLAVMISQTSPRRPVIAAEVAVASSGGSCP